MVMKRALAQIGLVLAFVTVPLASFTYDSSVVCTISIILMVSLHKATEAFLFTPLADRLEITNGTDKNRPRDKFVYNCWLFTIHLFFSVGILIYLSQKEQLSLAFLPWSHYNWSHEFFYGEPPPLLMSDALTWIYALQVGFYVTEMLSLFFDHPPGDFYEALIHHISTLSLILGSIYFNRAYFGIFVMEIHEIAEPLIVGGKAAHYAHTDTLSNIFYIIFVISWVFSRCITYPYWMYILPHVYFPTTFERCFFIGFLYCLQALHFYWTILIFKVAFRIVRNGLFNMKVTDEMDHSYSGDKVSELDKLKANYKEGARRVSQSRLIRSLSERDLRKDRKLKNMGPWATLSAPTGLDPPMKNKKETPPRAAQFNALAVPRSKSGKSSASGDSDRSAESDKMKKE